MRMMLDVFWNGMKRKSADLWGQVSALGYAAGAWIRDIWYRSVLRYDAFGY